MPRVEIEELLSERRAPHVIEGTATDITPDLPARIIPDEPQEPPRYQIPPGPLRQLDIHRLETKHQVMEQLNALLPLNKYDLPDYIYRADLIDHGMMLSALQELKDNPRKEVATKVQGMLHSAQVFLDYTEGYPKFEHQPLWRRLPFEPDHAYLAFQGYLALEGVRQLEYLISFEPADLKAWFHTYLWTHRVVAFDMYNIVDHQRRKIRRALGLENNHFELAGAIIDKVKAKMAEIGEGVDFWKELNPKDAVIILEKMIKVQRLSLGLSTLGGNLDEIPKNPSVQNMLEQISAVKEVKDDSAKDVADEIMSNPDALESAQNLLLELQGSKVD